MTERATFVYGGTLPADHAFYITRNADPELLKLCQEGAFAYVLTARQMGKSSLMVKTSQRLAETGIKPVIIDLTMIGGQGKELTAEQWYFGIISMVHNQLKLQINLKTWWHQQSRLGFVHRMTEFFRTVVLTEIKQRIVIFIDEIDTTLSLPFADDFFIAVRSLYNARSNNLSLRRLSFVLIGAAAPSDLIHDPQRTPFNIGHQVDLTDWTFDEAKLLIRGLPLPYEQGQQVLHWVLKWTGGHPYLTQRLLRTLVEMSLAHQEQVSILVSETPTNDEFLKMLLTTKQHSSVQVLTEADVDQATHKTFFGFMGEKDSNLQFVRTFLTRRTNTQDIDTILTTYRDIYRNKKPVPDDEQSVIKSHLKLSGIVRREHGLLRVRNAIYAEVFNEQWISRHLPFNWRKQTVLALQYLATILLIFSLPLTMLSGYLYLQATTAQTAYEALKPTADAAEKVLQQVGPAQAAQQTAETVRQTAIAEAQAARMAAANANAIAQSAATSRQKAVQDEQQAQLTATAAIARAQSAIIGKEKANETVTQLAQQITTLQTQIAQSNIQNAEGTMRRLFQKGDFQHSLLIGIEADKRGWHTDIIDTLMGNAISKAQMLHQKLSSITERGSPWSPDGQLVLIKGDNNAASVWSTADDKIIGILQTLATPLQYIKWSPKGTYALIVDQHQNSSIWDMKRYQIISTLTITAEEPIEAVWSPDEQRLLSIGPSGQPHVWSYTGQESAKFSPLAHSAPCLLASSLSADWEPGGSRVAVGYDCTVTILDVDTPNAQTTSLGHKAIVRSVQWSKDSTKILAALDDGYIHVWDVLSTQSSDLAVFVSAQAVSKALWSPNNQQILALSGDGQARIINIDKDKGSIVHSYDGHGGMLNNAMWSTDGQSIVVSSDSPTVNVWGGEQDKPQLTLLGHEKAVKYATWNSDGTRILTASDDQSIRIWNAIPEDIPTEPTKMLARAKALTSGMQLSLQELSDYFGDPLVTSTSEPTLPPSPIPSSTPSS